MKLLEGMKTRLKEIAKSYELNPHGAEIIIPTFSSKIGHGCEKFPEVEEYLQPWPLVLGRFAQIASR